MPSRDELPGPASEPPSASAPVLSHIGADGAARMVDVSEKPKTRRIAGAIGRIFLQPETLALIESNGIAKGNVLATARIAGIQAAKKTSGLIPLCHTLLLYHAQIDFEVEAQAIAIRCEVRTIGRTGAEMEALTGVSIAALTIYDMCKAVDKTMRIGDLTLTHKSKAELQ
jgi:cyclic pyranopterin phosphate synthase